MFDKLKKLIKKERHPIATDYNKIVRNYLRFSGKGVNEALLTTIQRNPRLSYDELSLILGKHYPKHPSADKSNEKECIILFLREISHYFRYDDGWVYFP